MDTFTKRVISLAILLNILSIILSGYAWAQTSKLSLPLPKAISIISLFFPIFASAAVPLVTKYFQARQNGFTMSTVAAYLFSILPFILIVLSTVFGIPTSLFTCSMENRWLHLFRIKDEQAIRTIQDTLRCCGLNSVQDRAWPFPSNLVDARACTRTQGWNIRCLDPWERQESTAAGMVGLANFSSLALLILLIYITQMRPQGLQSLHFGTLNSNHPTRLLGGLESGDREIHDEPGRRRGQPYSDVADGGEGHDQENMS